MRWLVAGFLGIVLLADRVAAREFDLSYSIYFGGAAIATFDARIEVNPDSWHVTTEARSTGFIGYLFPVEVFSEGSGRREGPQVTPDFYQSNGTFNGEPRRISVQARSGQAPEISLHPPHDPEERDEVPEALQQNTLDPYAALLTLALRTGENPCDAEIPVFNGRSRTDFHLRPGGTEHLAKSSYSVFTGAAEVCEISYDTVAGGYKGAWFGKDKTDSRLRLWVARLDGDGPWIPVRLMSEGLFGAVVGHLTAASGLAELAESAETKR